MRQVIPLLLALVVTPAGAIHFTQGGGPRDCRYARASSPGTEGVQQALLPEDDLFRPLLADLKEPRFYGYARRVRFRTDPVPSGGREVITAGVVGLGTTMGLWSRRRIGTCDGVQVGLQAGVFSQFNLSSPQKDLINSDFVVGIPLTLRQGGYSARLRLFHQSSHLGDEFLLNNPEVGRQDLSFEAVDALGSVAGAHWRAYAGGGYRFRTELDIDPASLQWGFEWRGEPLAGNLVPVFGADFQSFQEQEWAVTTSLAAGPELAIPGSNRRLRVLAVYLRGFLPFGQFFTSTRIENFGIGFQYDL